MVETDRISETEGFLDMPYLLRDLCRKSPAMLRAASGWDGVAWGLHATPLIVFRGGIQLDNAFRKHLLTR